jgi:hypothetical protein
MLASASRPSTRRILGIAKNWKQNEHKLALSVKIQQLTYIGKKLTRRT